jgi:hypothetical protein
MARHLRFGGPAGSYVFDAGPFEDQAHMLKKLILPTVLLAFAQTASAAPLMLSFDGGGWSAAPAPGVCIDVDNVAGSAVDAVRWGGGFLTDDQNRLDVVNPAHTEYIAGGDACWDSGNTGGMFGTPLGYLAEVSGYNFDPFEGASTTGGFINLGTFQHLNSVIEIAPNQLSYSYALNHNGGGGPLQFTVDFIHDETDNTAGGAGCCDDIVQITTPSLSALLQAGTDYYQFTLLGFGATGAEALSNFSFVSPEGATNSTYLWAQVTPVPEPATLTMLGTGLLGLGAAARRRMRKSRGN